jgi:hypothetical protein
MKSLIFSACADIYPLTEKGGKEMAVCFSVSGFLHGVRREFTDDFSKTAVGFIFTGHELERI